MEKNKKVAKKFITFLKIDIAILKKSDIMFFVWRVIESMPQSYADMAQLVEQRIRNA